MMSKKTEVHIERLLGKHVLDSEGKTAGRIEEILAEKCGDEWVVKEYEIGGTALLERLSVRNIATVFLGVFGAKENRGFRVPWDKLDLTDPQKPRLNCASHTLEPLSSSREKD